MTVLRTFDGDGIQKVMRDTPALKHIHGNIYSWLLDDKNIALAVDGGYGLFEYEYPGVYTGHYFLTIRGKKAFEACQEALSYLFDNLPVEVVRGLTPTSHKGALWMNRQLGCTHHGVTDTIAGPCMIVTLTKKDFKEGLI